MKYTVRLNGDFYQVEILDLRTRPVIAIVGGEQVEVWPEETGPAPCKEPVVQPVASSFAVSPLTGAIPSGGILDAKTVRAPIPGVIVEILVNPGDVTDYGQPLFIIEAMKMRNKIRASRAGTIAEVRVISGQTVNHNEPLLEYTE
jgi:biotin carboxyl carrier protein